MDYQKINRKWIFGLTLSVFGRNLVTYFIIACLNTIFGIAQGFVPLMGIVSLILMIYLGGVSFLVAHRTILLGETIAPGEAFAFSPRSKTYFWQYLFITMGPVIIGVLGGVALALSENLPYDVNQMALGLLAFSMGLYYVLMAFLGSSLVATAVGGDGMMMVSRGRITFFYTLIRLIILPTLAVLATGTAIYYGVLKDSQFSAASFIRTLGDSPNEAFLSIMLLSIGAQLVIILFNLITAVIITKAFLLAEVRLAVKGEPTEWGKQAFGISDQARGVVYR